MSKKSKDLPKKKSSKKAAEKPVEVEKELTEEQYEELMESLSEFQDQFLEHLAGSSQYEIIPSTDERGNPFSEKQLEMVRRECKRLGVKVLYTISFGKHTVIFNPDTLKTSIIFEQGEMH